MALVLRTCSECSGVGTRVDAAGGVFYPAFCRTCEGSGEEQVVMPDPLDESDLGYEDHCEPVQDDGNWNITREEFRAFSDEEFAARVAGLLTIGKE